MIKLPTDLTFTQVDKYKIKIIPLIDVYVDQEIITIDDSDLVQIDSMGMQFIIAVVNYIIAQGKEIKWQSKSNILKENMQQLSLSDAVLLHYIMD